VLAQQFTADQKLQVVLEGLRGEARIPALCERHGISEATYYNWQRAVLEGARGQLDESAPPTEGGLDETERQIIYLLQEDGRASFADMARQIGVAEGTVRRKLNRLVEEGMIRIVAVTDPFRVGLEAPVFVSLKVQPGKVPAVAARLAEMPNVRYVAATAGDHGLIAECLFVSREALSDFINEQIARLDGVISASTSLLLAIYKNSFSFGLPPSGGSQQR